MKVRLVHITQFLEIGGLESLIVELCRKLCKENYEISVLCLDGYDENYKEALERHSINVTLIKKNNRFDLKFFMKAAEYLKRKETDIVHSHGGCFFYSSIIGRLAGVRGLIHTIHGMPISSGRQENVEEFLSCLMTDRIVAVSDQIAGDIATRRKHFSGKIETIINGIDPDKFSPVADTSEISFLKESHGLPLTKKLIGTVGRLDPVKNYPLLLKAVAELTYTYGNDVHLVFVGSGSEEPLLTQMTGELGIDDRVSFLGTQYNVHRLYPLFDIFVLSSITEGTSLALLEAQSCGIPAVVTDVGGNSRIIRNGVNGILCPSGDHDIMAANIDLLLSSEAKHGKMGKAARETILENFSIDAMLAEYKRLYGSLLREDVVSSCQKKMDFYGISKS